MQDDNKNTTDDATVATDATVDPVQPAAGAADDASSAPAMDQPAAEPVSAPAEESSPADMPAKEEPMQPAGASASSDATPAGTDQQGRQLYNVKCSNCGKDTQVPFKPSADRPVYCRDCFTEMRNKQG